MMTMLEATRKWVSEFNAIPMNMIATLMSYDPDSWHEVTTKCVGNRVYCYDYCECGTIEAYNEETEMYIVALDSEESVEVLEDEMDFSNNDLPMWGTMWSFGTILDDDWLSDHDGINLMSMCGFKVYEHDEWGYFFGIDGAGYDFYEAHWIPLYKARGLKWHNDTTEI